MPDLITDVKNHIQIHDLILPNTVILVAVSGGADSITLLHMLNRLRAEWPFDIHIAHLNHQLRPNAHQDARFVQKIANRLKIPITTATTDVLSQAKKEKRSIEDAARQARRAFFEQTAQNIGASRVALGHTKSDQAETILFRLMRGTSLTGLAGIRPITDDFWIRPLLEITRQEVESYAKHHQLLFTTDETNTDIRFARNKIRHRLLPHIQEEYAPQIETALTRLGHIARAEDSYLENQSQTAFLKATLYKANRKIILDVKQIFGYHISLRRRLLKKALFGLGIAENAVTFEVIDRLQNCLDQPQAHMQISADWFAHCIEGLLILSRPAPPFNVPICLSGKTPFPIQNAHIVAQNYASSHTCVIASNDHYTALFDADQLPRSLFLREIQIGDRFQPFGIDGTQKVSKLLRDLKIPKHLRDEIPVLVGDNQILWVLGLRRSNYAPVTSKTKQIQQLIFEGGWQRIITHPETR